MCLSLPLLAQPIIFCILIIIPLSNRLYEAVSKKSNYPLFLASAFCIPAMSCAAGIALIVHILIPKCSEWRRLTTNLVQKQEVNNVSTATTTQTILLRESEVDGLLLLTDLYSYDTDKSFDYNFSINLLSYTCILINLIFLLCYFLYMTTIKTDLSLSHQTYPNNY